MEEQYLEHYGIKGQKWGERNYQYTNGSLTDLGRAHYGIGPARGSKAAQKNKTKAEKKKEKEKVKAEKKEKEAQENHEKLKEHVRNHPASFYKHRREFSEQETNDLIRTIQSDRKLKDLRNEEIERGWNKVKQISNNVNTLKQLAENAKGVYNLAAEVNNALIDSGKSNGKRWTKIGERPEQKKEKSWFDEAMEKKDWDTIKNNAANLDTDMMKRLSNYAFQQDQLEKYYPELFPKGKHLKHMLELKGDMAFSEIPDAIENKE